MRTRALILTMIILFSTLQSGCWDYEEYEDLVQVSAMGIDFDKKSNNIILSIQYIPTSKGIRLSGSESSGSSPQNKENIHSVTARTLYEAAGKLQQVISKKLFYGYLKVIVIGEEAAKYKLLDTIELLDRTPLIRSSSYIAITSGKAEDTISTFDTAKVASSSEEIYNLINSANKTGSGYVVSILDIMSAFAIPGIEATAPRVITVSNISTPTPEGGTGDNIKYDESRPGDNRVAGIGAFKGDKFVGWLNEQESLGFGLITGKDIIPYKVSQGSNNTTENTIYYRLTSSNGKIKVQINNDKPVFKVDVKVVADLRKYYSHKGSDFLGPKVISEMEKKLSYSIRSDIQAALKKGQKELRTDIFGFGFALFREDPKLWRDKYDEIWYSTFPNIPIYINVKAKILNSGTNIRRLYIDKSGISVRNEYDFLYGRY